MGAQKEGDLELDVALHFRDELRKTRAVALKDAEGFDQIVFVLERLGVHLSGAVKTLNHYLGCIQQIARRSPLAEVIPGEQPEWHSPFSKLYTLVRQGRNDALHQGAFARHLTTHAVQLALILEDGLMDNLRKAREFMVRDPVCASLWQPISFVRQTMLENSFSFLPVAPNSSDGTSWQLVWDFALARYLRSAKSEQDRIKLLANKLGDAVQAGKLALKKAPVCGPEADINTLFDLSDGLPVLVVGSDGNLRGIVTPFDVL